MIDSELLIDSEYTADTSFCIPSRIIDRRRKKPDTNKGRKIRKKHRNIPTDPIHTAKGKSTFKNHITKHKITAIDQFEIAVLVIITF